jgi:hypothetical protein
MRYEVHYNYVGYHLDVATQKLDFRQVAIVELGTAAYEVRMFDGHVKQLDPFEAVEDKKYPEEIFSTYEAAYNRAEEFQGKAYIEGFFHFNPYKERALRAMPGKPKEIHYRWDCFNLPDTEPHYDTYDTYAEVTEGTSLVDTTTGAKHYVQGVQQEEPRKIFTVYMGRGCAAPNRPMSPFCGQPIVGTATTSYGYGPIHKLAACQFHIGQHFSIPEFEPHPLGDTVVQK